MGHNREDLNEQEQAGTPIVGGPGSCITDQLHWASPNDHFKGVTSQLPEGSKLEEVLHQLKNISTKLRRNVVDMEENLSEFDGAKGREAKEKVIEDTYKPIVDHLNKHLQDIEKELEALGHVRLRLTKII